ncbi:MAG TPA: sigma-70 family RNA polymerase sigma factor [Bryobacteraceae bacterium]|nr:sigma-70 family RNA polymerase sigma factor [Bryobacteraceae bacterium]
MLRSARAFPIAMQNGAPCTGEEALVRRAAAGDRGAFGELYERYSRVVHGVILARLRPADAEDLVQEVFMTAMRKLHTLAQPAAFPAWLITIARHHAIDYYRSNRRQSELDERMPDRPRNEPGWVLNIIQTLPEAYRETLILRLVEGLTGPEIAERTGLTHGSVRVNLCRGMEMLREKLGGAR